MALACCAWGQDARLVFLETALGQPHISIAANSYLVIGNSLPGGLTCLPVPSSGNIYTEVETSRVRWAIGSNMGTYVIPFTSVNGVKIPLTYQVSSAGVGAGSISFSTFNYGAIAGTNWNNDLYRPSDVTTMNGYSGSNNSDNVVDRFWIIDPIVANSGLWDNYTTKPSVRLSFMYDPGAASGDVRTGNTITGLSPVGAQRFNAPLATWGDFLPTGIFTGGVVNSVTDVGVSSADFFRSWTLVNTAQPLPVELVKFTGSCAEGQATLTWTTASELSNSHFTIERSLDLLDFDEIGVVAGIGNSVVITDYQFVDEQAPLAAYYRLQQVDFDGTATLSDVVHVSCAEGDQTHIVTAWDNGTDLSVKVMAGSESIQFVRLLDACGKEVWNSSGVALASGVNIVRFPKRSIAPGIYTFVLQSNGHRMMRRVNVH